MRLEIITPERHIYDGETALVQLPGSDGLFEILNNHAPMIAALGNGKVKVQNPDGKLEYFDIRGGVVEVLDNKILVLAD
ncbi:MAG: ATP synthase F1 subunit epsilon [Bacteroidales bacterium]|nr:ATP synthase F1 subunit epsilon [Bacteroidales bacterium]